MYKVDTLEVPHTVDALNICDCGEILDGIPQECPSCAAARPDQGWSTVHCLPRSWGDFVAGKLADRESAGWSLVSIGDSSGMLIVVWRK